MMTIECPVCEIRFQVSRSLDIGDRIQCPECGEMLRVRSINPTYVDIWNEGDYDDGYEDYLRDYKRIDGEEEDS